VTIADRAASPTNRAASVSERARPPSRLAMPADPTNRAASVSERARHSPCIPLLLLLASAGILAGCKDTPRPSADAAAPAATVTAASEEFKLIPSCSCPGFELSYRVVREGDEPGADPARRHHVDPEFRLTGGGKTWVFKPAGECALPQRMFANTLKLGVACSDKRLVLTGPHWASAFSVGRESWTRRIDGDPMLADDLLKPMRKPAGVGAPEWGEPERADASKVSITCEKLTVDQSWVQIADWGGNTRWYEMAVGRQR
jgi:hypothetical protein